jgi:murein DD-endopeptidase MepM/ murein hydrolase activator NlpD
MRCKNEYILPADSRFIDDVLTWASPVHQGALEYAVDFVMNEGTPILAACEGIVAYVKQDSSVGGRDSSYWDQGNRIVIRHANCEYSAYEHLTYNSAKVMLGDRVERGRQIALSGNTGLTTGPHLHFEVFHRPSSDDSEGETLKVKFKELNYLCVNIRQIMLLPEFKMVKGGPFGS